MGNGGSTSFWIAGNQAWHGLGPAVTCAFFIRDTLNSLSWETWCRLGQGLLVLQGG